MATFEALDDDFGELNEAMRRSTQARLKSSQGEEQKRVIKDLERSKERAESLLRSMEAEIQRSPAYQRANMRDRLTSNKRTLESTMSVINHVTREAGDLDDMEGALRSRLMQGTQSLQRASDSVHRSRQIAEETDEVGVNIIGELDRQGDALERTRDRLSETQSALNKSSKLLRGMAFRVVTSKLIMALIIIVELGILAGVIYIRFVKK